MFLHLNLTSGEFWKILLWKDNFNYAGFTESNPSKLTYELNICRHLPVAV
jgi:hypothetical protein